MPINPEEISTIRVGELPIGAISLDSKLAIENGTDLIQITAQDLVNFININSNAFQFEEKTLHVDQTYIDTNFDSTGLGILLMEGWAICNGNNGTLTMDGKVNVGYGINYSAIGGIGGSKDSVVVSHYHKMFANEVVDGGALSSSTDKVVKEGFNGGADGNQNYRLRKGVSAPTLGGTSSEGVDGTNRNMQPYRIALKIMKL